VLFHKPTLQEADDAVLAADVRKQIASTQRRVVGVVINAVDDNLLKGEQIDTRWSRNAIKWWEEPLPALAPVEQPAPALKPTRPGTTGTLFNLEPEEPSATASGTGEPAPEWVRQLVRSSVFIEQKQFAGRGVPEDDLFLRVLGSLDHRGGKMTSVALARALQFPSLRLPGLLTRMQRILNVDGYPVLSRDDASDTIELNRDLLLSQFDLV
jgi:hypothetical protein